jgi:uncharacterized membrane protein YedE/YeeE
MLTKLHIQFKLQLLFGFITGIIFGFLLQKGGVGRYNVIINQLLLKDFTVLKIILSAVVTGMIGIYFLKGKKLVELHPKSGSLGMTVVGGLIFGIGFAVLGYCPGTISAAIGQGNLDALSGGLIGIILGAGLFAQLYPKIQKFLKIGWFGAITWPELFKVNPWVVIVPLSLIIIAIFFRLEAVGL